MEDGGILVSVKCKKCKKENAVIIPVEVSEEQWIKAQKRMDKSETKVELVKTREIRSRSTLSMILDLNNC